MKHQSSQRGPGQDGVRALYLPEVGTVEAVARHLHLPPATVRRLIREGPLAGRKVAGRWYVTRRALLAFIESGKHLAEGSTPRPAWPPLRNSEEERGGER